MAFRQIPTKWKWWQAWCWKSWHEIALNLVHSIIDACCRKTASCPSRLPRWDQVDEDWDSEVKIFFFGFPKSNQSETWHTETKIEEDLKSTRKLNLKQWLVFLECALCRNQMVGVLWMYSLKKDKLKCSRKRIRTTVHCPRRNMTTREAFQLIYSKLERQMLNLSVSK